MYDLKGKIIFIEGNIGSGKTSLIENLRNYISTSECSPSSYNILEEPIYEFTNFENFNPLKDMYEKKISVSEFQTYIVDVMVENMKRKILPNKINIIERSVFSAVEIFSRMHFDKESISDFMFLFLQKRMLERAKDFIKHYEVSFVYLQTTVAVSLERIKKRQREGEQNLDYSFIQTVHDYHSDFINNITYDGQYNLITIDANDILIEVLKSFIDKCL